MTKIWHPFTQHGLKEDIIEIDSSYDEFLITKNGEKIIDAISSWWVNTLGHSNPVIMSAIEKQAKNLQQIIFAGYTHQPAQEVARKLGNFLPKSLEYTFFSDSGSICTEVGLKMAVGYFHNKYGNKYPDGKSKIVAFKHSYHGDSFGAMSSGARSVFNYPYRKMLFEVEHLSYPKKGDEQKTLDEYKKLLEKEADKIAAIILEPLVLGSGGMLMYEPFVLDELYKMSKEYDVLFILDEVMTGFGRTGTMFAFEQTKIIPDIICLSKGITGGAIPLAVTVCTKEIYDAFLSNDKSKMFFHSSSYTANPIACAAASANLDIWKNEDILAKINKITKYYKEKSSNFSNCRILGDIFALDLDDEEGNYLSDIGIKAYDFYRKNNVLLRPLGNTVYVMPPYCISKESLDKVFDLIEKTYNF